MKINLPRFPFSNDCLTVWKRTRFVEGLSDSSDEEDEDDNDDDEDDGDEAPMLVKMSNKVDGDEQSNTVKSKSDLKPWEVVNEKSKMEQEWTDASEWNEQADEEEGDSSPGDKYDGKDCSDSYNEDEDSQFGDDHEYCSNQWGDVTLW